MPYQAFDPATGERAYFHEQSAAIAWCAGRPAAYALTNFHTEGDYVFHNRAGFAAHVGQRLTA